MDENSTLINNQINGFELNQPDNSNKDNIKIESNLSKNLKSTINSDHNHKQEDDNLKTILNSISRPIDELINLNLQDNKPIDSNEELTLENDLHRANDESSNYVSLSNSISNQDESMQSAKQALSDEKSNDEQSNDQQSNDQKSNDSLLNQENDLFKNEKELRDEQLNDKNVNVQVDQSLNDKSIIEENADQFKEETKQLNDKQVDVQIDQSKELELKNESDDSEQLSDKFVELFDYPDLLKRTLKRGNEKIPKPEKSTEVLINIEIRNHDTGELIESESKQGQTILIGDFDLVHGVDLALLTMHLGEIAEIIVKPSLGYGPIGTSDIPSNCVLICKVELIKITLPEEMGCGSFKDLKHYFNLSKSKKERGNFFFKRQEFTTALHCYTRSEKFLDFFAEEMLNRHTFLTNIKDKAAELRKQEMEEELILINELSAEYMKVKLDIFNNLSAVHIKMKSYNKALEAVNGALSVNRDDIKALYRKSTILSHQGSFEEAINCIKYGIKLDPNNRTFQNELKILKTKLRNQIKEEKALYSKMLAVNKKGIYKKRNKSNQNFYYLGTGVVISGIVLGSFILYRKFFKN